MTRFTPHVAASTSPRIWALALTAAVAWLGSGPHHVSAQARVAVDITVRHQTMEGFGATTISLKFGTTDNVPATLRPLAIAALYRDVRLNMGNLEVEPCESSSTNVYAPANDDGDPLNINPAGFNWLQSDNMHDLVVAPGAAYGFGDYYLGPVVGTGYALAFVRAFHDSDYNRYLDEIAEHVVAVATHWRDTYGITPRYLAPFNEPTSGNGEVPGANGAELVDIVRRIGARLRAAGLTTLLVVPSEEREDISLANARLILEDPEASGYVGAIGYHPYPYGSTYAAVPNILSTSGAGAPDASKIALRNQLRDLAAAHGVKVFMTEVSHSELPFDDFRNVRGRAIHIHDELTYADAAAFFGMNAMWDTVSHAQHFAGRADPGFWNETDTIALIDVEAGTVTISPMGRAIGHYARFVTRGAVRVDATSDDPLVLATAFEDPASGRLVVVAINDATAPRDLVIPVTGAALSGAVEGELSTPAAAWVRVTDATVDVAGATLRFTIPAGAVVTLSASIAGAVIPDGGTIVVDGGSAADSDGGGVAPGSDGGPSAGIDAGLPPGAGAIARPADDGCGCHVLGARTGRAGPLCGLLVLAVCLTVRRRRTRRATDRA